MGSLLVMCGWAGSGSVPREGGQRFKGGSGIMIERIYLIMFMRFSSHKVSLSDVCRGLRVGVF